MQSRKFHNSELPQEPISQMPVGKARGGSNPAALYDDPLSLAPPGRSSRGHFPAAPSVGWSSEGMAIAPAFVASIRGLSYDA